LRFFNAGNFFDTVVFTMDTTGSIKKSVSISNSYTLYDMYSTNNGVLSIKGNAYFTGWSYGYAT